MILIGLLILSGGFGDRVVDLVGFDDSSFGGLIIFP